MDSDRPADWHPQDWLLIAEALVRYRWWDDVNGEREQRGRELICAIAAEEGFTPAEYVLQIDD